MKNIYAHYVSDLDITIIFETCFENGNTLPISEEIVGWYYGEPNEEDNKTFYGKLKATFEW